MTKKEIEDYINTYRIYPKEYTGKRSDETIKTMDSSHKYNAENNTIARIEGSINKDGDFVLDRRVTFSLDDPTVKTIRLFKDVRSDPYNRLMLDLGYPEKIVTDTVNSDWNLRDKVSEASSVLKHYFHGGIKSGLRITDINRHNNETHRLWRFIHRHRDQIEDLTVTVKHGSKFDNL